MRKINKKTIIVTALALCLIVAAVGGTMAWLNSQDSLENVFTVGQFSDPTIDPDDPENPLDPETPDYKLNGHLYESNWEENSKFVPGATIPKNPRVGIGEGSEDAYVYLWVNNNTKNNMVYFKLNENWEPVENYYTEATLEAGDPEYEVSQTFYTGGLFRYKVDETNNRLVAAQGDAWTTPAFDNVYVRNDAVLSDLAKVDTNGDVEEVYTINVTALIHQATSGDVTDLQTDADTWAKEQATKLAQ